MSTVPETPLRNHVWVEVLTGIRITTYSWMKLLQTDVKRDKIYTRSSPRKARHKLPHTLSQCSSMNKQFSKQHCMTTDRILSLTKEELTSLIDSVLLEFPLRSIEYLLLMTPVALELAISHMLA